jgi:very-short-patch-repair endonuclease
VIRGSYPPLAGVAKPGVDLCYSTFPLKTSVNPHFLKCESFHLYHAMEDNNHSNNNYNLKLKPYANNLRKDMTKSEACLWKYVLRNSEMKGYVFRRQRPVLNYIADFACLPLKLIIEVDGFTHNDSKAIEYDKKRDDDLQKAGFRILRFSAFQVLRQINSVREIIEDWIEEWEKSNIRSTPGCATPASGG